MAVYERIEKAQGGSLYKNVTEDKVVEEDKIPAAVKEELDIQEPGTQIDEDTITGDGLTDSKSDGEDPKTTDPAEPNKPATPAVTPEADDEVAAPTPAEVKDSRPAEAPVAFSQPVPQSEPGMGFPRVNGKTVDIFDGVTPHTNVRNVEGFLVPLSTENYNKKTDTEIYQRLQEMGYLSK